MSTTSLASNTHKSDTLIVFFERRGCFWATLGIAAAILIYRRPDAVLDPCFWAEDGARFFVDARERGIFSLVSSFANYPMLFTRLCAYAASFFPDRMEPGLYNLAAFINHMAVIVLLFSERIPLRWKPLLGIFSVLAPVYGNEALFNLTNSQWQSAQILMLLILSNDGVSKKQQWFDWSVLFLTGLSGPFLVLFLPLILARWWIRRSPSSANFAMISLALMAVQVAMLFALPVYGAKQSGINLANPIWMGVYGDSIAGVLLTGVKAPLYFENSFLMTLLSICLYGFLCWDGLRRRDYLQLALLYASLVVLLAASASWRSHPEIVIQSPRYHYLHRVFFFWAMVQSAAQIAVVQWPVRMLAAWAIVVSILGAQSYGVMQYSWPQASRLLALRGHINLPCLQPSWRVHTFNVDEKPSAITRTRVLAEGQAVVIGFAKDRQPQSTMRMQAPLESVGLTFHYRAKALDEKQRHLKIEFGRPGKAIVDPTIHLPLIADGLPHEITFYSGGSIEGWILECEEGLQEVVIDNITILK